MGCSNNNNSNSVNNTINNCVRRVESKCCPPLVYPRNQNGFPFSGNTNTPGSRLTSVRVCSLNIQSRQSVNIKNKIIKGRNVNDLGRVTGGLGGSGRAIRNVF